MPTDDGYMTLGEARDLIECELMEQAATGGIIGYRSTYLTDGLGTLHVQLNVALPPPPQYIEIKFSGRGGD
jgi:hypothetical protein